MAGLQDGLLEFGTDFVGVELEANGSLPTACGDDPSPIALDGDDEGSAKRGLSHRDLRDQREDLTTTAGFRYETAESQQVAERSVSCHRDSKLSRNRPSCNVWRGGCSKRAEWLSVTLAVRRSD